MGLFSQLDIELRNYPADVERAIASDRNPDCPSGFMVLTGNPDAIAQGLDPYKGAMCPRCGHELHVFQMIPAGQEYPAPEIPFLGGKQ